MDLNARTLVRSGWTRFRLRRRTGLDATLQGISAVGEQPPGRMHARCIVFSKDRPMQLDACLRSIERSAPYDGSIVVVYQATTQEFADGYRLLELGERVRLVQQGDDFQQDVVDAIDSESRYTVFQTDDDVFFRNPPAAPELPDNFAAFSLRLGVNTTYCYPLRTPQAVPALAAKGPFIAWDWTRAAGDFSYPLSLDGHVMHTEWVVRMLSRVRFTNPNRLEEELQLRRSTAPPLMLAFRESCLVSLPLNVVTSTHQNRAGNNPDLSAEALNRRFLAGERIDLDAMDFSEIHGAHQEVAPAFKGADRP